jgi:hypothetical protein
MIEWAYAFMFATALGLGWAASIHWGGYTERATMCLLSCIWLGVVIAQWATNSNAPFMFFATLDMAGIIWLWQHQRRNWQWIPASIFVIMLACHVAYWAGAGIETRLYLDTVALLAYLQIGSVMWASKARRNVDVGEGGVVYRWAVADSWLPRRVLDRSRNAEV